MACDIGMTYRFAQNGPITALLRRSVALSIAIGTVSMAAVCIAGVVPLLLFPFMESVLVVVALGTYYFGLSQFKRGLVFITPTHLVVENWFSKQGFLWKDIASISSEEYAPKSAWQRGLMRLVYGRSHGMEFVKVSLSRAKFVSGIPAMRVVALWIEDPERFVAEAQQYLAVS